MEERLPYYMVYPMPLMYDDEKKNRRDYEYMKSLYPKTAKRLLPYVEEECDRLEYTASMMYDECPDLLQLRLLCRRNCAGEGKKNEHAERNISDKGREK